MRKKLPSIFFVILSIIAPAAAFYLVYRYTDILFQKQKYPYPFEHFGIAAGLGTACFVHAFVLLISRIFDKFSKHFSGSAYSVEEKIKSDKAKILSH